MTGFPTFDAVAAALLTALLAFWAGSAWGRVRERADADREAEQEHLRALQATSLWRQQAQLHRGPEAATTDERSRSEG